MFARICCLALVGMLAGGALGAETAPAVKPATKPTARVPATLPSVGCLVAKMKQMKEEKENSFKWPTST